MRTKQEPKRIPYNFLKEGRREIYKNNSKITISYRCTSKMHYSIRSSRTPGERHKLNNFIQENNFHQSSYAKRLTKYNIKSSNT